jgi:hypothetical protein
MSFNLTSFNTLQSFVQRAMECKLLEAMNKDSDFKATMNESLIAQAMIAVETYLESKDLRSLESFAGIMVMEGLGLLQRRNPDVFNGNLSELVPVMEYALTLGFRVENLGYINALKDLLTHAASGYIYESTEVSTAFIELALHAEADMSEFLESKVGKTTFGSFLANRTFNEEERKHILQKASSFFSEKVI